ncbi:unnamed protein product, partial [marine sediment metagenome]
MGQSLVIPITSVEAQGRDLVGGKAANLACLADKGFLIPAGFCVTTVAFDAFSNLEPSRKFRELVESHARRVLKSSRTSKLIVRSSANVEDSPNHAFP